MTAGSRPSTQESEVPRLDDSVYHKQVINSPALIGDPARERRVKALALTAPLHDLEQNKSLRGWQAFDCYDLALATIDAVVDKMGFDSGIRRTDLDGVITQEAARFAPEANETLHRDVAVHIIETLIRPQQAVYEAAEDGRRRRFDFRLLDEVESGDGIYVRATDAAINVLVGALDTDLESAHEAAEARLHVRLGHLRKQPLAHGSEGAGVPAGPSRR